MIMKRIVDCKWQIILSSYNLGRYDLIEVLATYETVEEAIANQPSFFDRLSGSSNSISIRYHEEILSEETVE
jgi:hypothetical protein